MRSRSRFVLAVLAAAATGSSACSSSDAPSTPDLAERLEGDTGVRWGVRTDDETHEVRFLAPAQPVSVAGATPETKARAFFARYATELHATSEELRLVETTTDDDGRAHVRFAHVLAGTDVPVFGAATRAHFTKDGAIDYLQPDFRSGLDGVSSHAAISEQSALQTANGHVVGACGASAGALTKFAVERGVSSSADFPAGLAWRVRLKASDGRCAAPEVWIDAQSGAVLAVYDMGAALEDRKVPGSRYYLLKEADDLKTLDVSPVSHVFGPDTYRLETSSFPKVLTRRYQTLVTASDIETPRLGEWDRASFGEGGAVDAHYYTTKALEYFKSVHGRRGLNGLGTRVTVVVHDNSSFNDHGDNAFNRSILLWDELHVGDGSLTGGDQLPQGSAFDTMAHELTHGITAHTSELAYMREYGALNESFSDVMGACAENWLDETRHAKNNLVFSERSSKTNRPSRDMEDPGRFGQPDHYGDFRKCEGLPWLTNDSCWVHRNSGIPNRAFSLMTVGGTHKKSKVTIARGIGWELSRKLWFKTITGLSKHAHFVDAATAQVREAASLGPDVLRAVACTWHAVGVLALDPRIDPLLAAIGCGPAPAEPPAAAAAPVAGCNGRSSGYVCSDATPGFAYACNAGALPAYCADSAQHCKRASASDGAASVGADGVLVCE